MKKLLAFALVAALAAPTFAAPEEDVETEDTVLKNGGPTIVESQHKQVGVWPAFLAVGEIPAAVRTPDIVGLRLTIPFSTKHDSVTGFDLGLWGRARNFEGFMCSILRNDAKESFAGLQLGVYNSVGQADLFGVQAGIFNEAVSICGAQVGLVNVVGQAQGLQLGLINRAEELYGVQIGLVNVIRDAEIKFCPIVNVGF